MGHLTRVEVKSKLKDKRGKSTSQSSVASASINVPWTGEQRSLLNKRTIEPIDEITFDSNIRETMDGEWREMVYISICLSASRQQ